MHQYNPVELSKRTMKAKALAIAGALSVVSIALPQSAKAHEEHYDQIYTLSRGSFTTLCSLYFIDLLSTSDMHSFQRFWMNMVEDDKERKTIKDAADDLLEREPFKSDCPLLRY